MKPEDENEKKKREEKEDALIQQELSKEEGKQKGGKKGQQQQPQQKQQKKGQQPVKEVLDGFQLEIKVGQIVEAMKHPNSDHLLALKVDLGEGKVRSIVAGLAEHYTPEQLLN